MNASMALIDHVPADGLSTAQRIASEIGATCRTVLPQLNQLLAEGRVERKNFPEESHVDGLVGWRRSA